MDGISQIVNLDGGNKFMFAGGRFRNGIVGMLKEKLDLCHCRCFKVNWSSSPVSLNLSILVMVICITHKTIFG